VSLSIGAHWGTWGSLFTGNFKRYLEGFGKGASLSVGALLGEPGEVGGGSFFGDLEGYGEEGSGDRHHFLRGPHWEI